MAAYPGNVSEETEAPRSENVKPQVAGIYGANPSGNSFNFTKINLLIIWGVVLAHIIVEYATVATIMLYLLNVIGQPLLIAAITINVFDGLSAMLVFVIAYLSDAYTSRFNAIVFSTGAYTMGLFVLWITSYTSKEFGICNVALSLIAVGRSERCSTLRSHFEYKLRKENGCIESARKHQTTQDRRREQQRDIGINIWWYSAWIFGYVIVVFAIGGTTQQECFKISALLMLAMFLVFYSGSCCYDKDDPNRKSLGEIMTSLNATSRKLYLWVTFIPYGLVLATGYTLFIAQIANMNIHIGNNFRVPSSFFFVLKSFISNIVVFLCSCGGPARKGITVTRIGVGMLCAALCCVVAWLVELQRLYITKKEGLTQDPTKMSSMSVKWLIPQYALLGLMEGLAGDGLVTHINCHLPISERSFAEHFSELMCCIGKFSSIFFLLLCNSWFGETINVSRLDRYFLVLAIICFLFFCFYLFWWRNYENYLELVTSQGTGETGNPIDNPLNEAKEDEDRPEIPEDIEEDIKDLQSPIDALKDEDTNMGEDQNPLVENRV